MTVVAILQRLRVVSGLPDELKKHRMTIKHASFRLIEC